MEKSLFKSTITIKEPDNYIVWYNHVCTLFKDQTAALEYIDKCRYNDPGISFSGWFQSFDGSNFVTTLEGLIKYDPDIANEYLWKKYLAPQRTLSKDKKWKQ